MITMCMHAWVGGCAHERVVRGCGPQVSIAKASSVPPQLKGQPKRMPPHMRCVPGRCMGSMGRMPTHTTCQHAHALAARRPKSAVHVARDEK